MGDQILQKIRIIKFFLLGALLLLLALLLPVFLRAVDLRLVGFAGSGEPPLVSEIDNQIQLASPGAARLLLEGARQCGIQGLDGVAARLERLESDHPDLVPLGGVSETLASLALPQDGSSATMVEMLIPAGNRARLISGLESSRRPGVRVILDLRSIRHTQILSPVPEPGGAVLETVLAAMALLSQENSLRPSFRIELERLASDAGRGMSARDLEELCLDLLPFARRMNWGQFSAFLSRFEDRGSLGHVARALSSRPERLPTLFAAVWVSPSATPVARYLERWPETGLEDIARSLAHGSRGLDTLLSRGHRLYQAPAPVAWLHRAMPSASRDSLSALALSFPILALFGKYLALGLGAFLCIRGLSLSMPRAGPVLRYFEVDALATPRHLILTLFALLALVLLGEPFLAQKEQTVDIAPGWSFPTAPEPVVEAVDNLIGGNKDEITLLALAVFFLIQVGLYIMCRLKLREIERHKGSTRLKLKLLDNEDNMFDSGLYVGLGGTVLSLVLLSLKLAEISLMAAYSSTLFGIIFTSVLKIFHVRPYRRRLLIEGEAGIL